ncbi:hypothetical protein PAXRUDRAFT_21252 [Paxillus rubicundulus Ve08.2h10]|uniref:Uncharacterized protein n=1 Tax=Paxillus rubicundulus Ve08.2h10 TaxID=930991 RepID=A0A0D0BNC1_9AGAM|nr:hypothetical protein PAXRUDRAFT_21252 [Paxillus rubicundulus Ve08.2h10]
MREPANTLSGPPELRAHRGTTQTPTHPHTRAPQITILGNCSNIDNTTPTLTHRKLPYWVTT